MTNKFKKITTITKAAVIIKIFAKTDNNYPKTYKQIIIFKNKHKWFTVMKDKLQLQKT